CALADVMRDALASVRHDSSLPMPRLRVGALPKVVADPQVVRVVIWAAIVALLKSARRRGARVKLVRVSARESAHGWSVRVGRLDPVRRGAGVEELLLARRLAARHGLALQVRARAHGGHSLLIEFPQRVPATPRPRGLARVS